MLCVTGIKFDLILKLYLFGSLNLREFGMESKKKKKKLAGINVYKFFSVVHSVDLTWPDSQIMSLAHVTLASVLSLVNHPCSDFT